MIDKTLTTYKYVSTVPITTFKLKILIYGIELKTTILSVTFLKVTQNNWEMVITLSVSSNYSFLTDWIENTITRTINSPSCQKFCWNASQEHPYSYWTLYISQFSILLKILQKRNIFSRIYNRSFKPHELFLACV